MNKHDGIATFTIKENLMKIVNAIQKEKRKYYTLTNLLICAIKQQIENDKILGDSMNPTQKQSFTTSVSVGKNIKDKMDEHIKEMGIYFSRSDFMRTAVTNLLMEDLKEFKTKNPKQYSKIISKKNLEEFQK